MASEAINVINAVCKNKDIFQILGEDAEVFGEWSDVFKDLKDYYSRHHTVPSIEALQKINRDVEAVEVDEPTKAYVERMKEQYVQEQLNNLLFKTGKFLQDDRPPMTILEGLQKQIARLTRQSTIVHDVNIMDIDAAVEHYDEVRKRAEENGGAVGIPTGFKGIDSAYTTGMAPGHLIYAMGFSGNGKTWFVNKLATQAWKMGRKPLVVSMEMTPEAMRNRLYTLIGQGIFRDSELGRGQYNTQGMEKFRELATGKPEFVVVGGTAGQDVTPNVIQAKIDQHHPDIVVVDYQQLMMDNERNQQITPRMTALSRELKLLAVNNNIPIVVISAVTDNDQGRNKPPTIDQLAWARAMEYSADIVFAVHKLDDSTLEIVGRKNRFGDLWDMLVEIDLNSGIFREVFGAPGDSTTDS